MTVFASAGDFSVDTDSRTVRGLLLPWGETSRLSASDTPPIAFDRGTVRVPQDVSVISANRHHDRHDPVGRATSIEDTEAGLVATFAIANNPEGDEFLSQYADGTIRKLSAEIAGIVRNGAKAVSARLTGAGFVTEGAFASAALFAVALEDVPEEVATAPTRDEVIDLIKEEVARQLAEATETPTPNPEQEASLMANATAPNTMQAAVAAEPELTASGVFELITKARTGMGNTEAETLLAALADAKTSGTGAIASPGVIQPAWLGEIWAERSYTRRYAPLVKNGSITNVDEKGFTMSTAAELVQAYSGNKADMPTGLATTALVGSSFQRWGYAVDIAREFFDIPGNNEVIEAFLRRIVNSYARVTDKYVLQQLFAAAGAGVAPDTFPAGYDSAIGKLLQGIDLIEATDVDATFIIVAPDVHKALRYTPKDKIPEFITLGVGSQDATADGVSVIRDKFNVLPAGSVLVGSKDAAHYNELGGGSPILIDALDIARGGIDKGAVGYSQWMTEYPEGIRLIKNAA